MPSHYSGDPYWLTARRPGPCACGTDGHAIKRGDSIFYYPRSRAAYVGACADRASADFDGLVMDEDLYNGRNY